MCSDMKRPSILQDVRMQSDVKLHLSNYCRCITACPISSSTPDRACSRLCHNFHVVIHRQTDRHNRGLHELPLWLFLSADTRKLHNMSYTRPNLSDVCHILSQMSPNSSICLDSFLHHVLLCSARHEAHWRQTTKQASTQCWEGEKKRLAFVSQLSLYLTATAPQSHVQIRAGRGGSSAAAARDQEAP